jgi:hypothetical protein
MRFAADHRRAYWSSGGDVLMRGGGLGLDEAVSLERFYRGGAAQPGDAGAYCETRAAQLAAAIAAAAGWRQAARYQRRREPLSARYCSADGVSTN